VNWVDVVILAAIVVTVFEGAAKGFLRSGIGFIAMVCGFFLGMWLYPYAGGFAQKLPPHWANLQGFAVVFVLVLVVGAIIEWILGKLRKDEGKSWIDRLAGAGMGLVRGVVGATVVLQMVLAFMPKPMPRPVRDSRFAPAMLSTARVLAESAPYEIKEGFRRGCEELENITPPPVRKHLPRLPVTEI
jgi:membrane protein required for colicin V production